MTKPVWFTWIHGLVYQWSYYGTYIYIERCRMALSIELSAFLLPSEALGAVEPEFATSWLR